MNSFYDKKHKIVLLIFLLTTIAVFVLIVFIHKNKTETQRLEILKKHAEVIKTSLWTYEKNAHAAYLELAVESNNYEELTVFDDTGKVFIQMKAAPKSMLKKTLIYMGIIEEKSFKTDILYESKKVGELEVLWRNESFFFYLYVFVFMLLIFLALWLFTRLSITNTSLLNQSRLLKKAKEDAESASKSKSSFLANMSHEIRTPMNAIIGLNHLISKTQLTQTQRDYFCKLESSSQHLLQIINNILDFSKIEADKIELEKVNFSITEIIENIKSVIIYKIEQKGLTLDIDIDKNVHEIFKGDSLRLTQILTNLLNNAVKFTETGSISLSVKEKTLDSAHVELLFSVKDSGIGINEEGKKRLFVPFEQTDSSTTRKYGGTGLGLSICKKLVEMMDGKIWVESSIGTGSVFYFTVIFEQISLGVLPPDLAGRTALVVEDNFAAQNTLCSMLKELGIVCETAVSGESALELLLKNSSKYKFLFIDWQLPGMDGFSLIKEMRNNGKIKEPVTFITTAYGTPEVIQQAKNLEIKGLLIKPFSKELVIESIISAMSELKSESQRNKKLEQKNKKLRLNILLAEDNFINQQVLSEILKDFGCETTIAENGQIALEKAKTHKYDLIIMDLQMPIMDGFQSTDLIRKYESSMGKRTFIIAMSASIIQEDIDMAKLSGVDEYITKPVEPEKLFRLLEKISHELTKEISGDHVRSTVIDLEKGISTVLGKKDLYYSLLKQFYDQHKDTGIKLKTDIENKDYCSARKKVHSIAGVASNLGALELFQSALNLEMALYKNQSDIELLTKDFHYELNRAMAEIIIIQSKSES